MTDENDLELTADGDPWAPGGAMSRAPLPPAPEVSFDRRPDTAGGARPGSEHRAHLTGDASRAAHDDAGGEPGSAAPGPEGRWRERVGSPTGPAVVGVAVAAVAALVVGGIWTAARDGGGGPAAERDPPTTTPAESPPPSSIDAPPTTVAESPAGEQGAGASSVDGVQGAILEPPPALRGLDPTELLVLTSRSLMQLDLPSGLVTTLAAGLPVDDPELAVSDNAVVVWADGAERMIVVRRATDPIELLTRTAVSGVVAERDDEFLLQPVAGAEPRSLSIEPVLWSSPLEFPVGDPNSAEAHPGGDLMVPGDVGTYLLTDAGPIVIHGGYTLAVGRNHVVYRVCGGDDARDGGCRLTRDDVVTGVRTDLDNVAAGDVIPGTSPFTLSPDGGALTRPQFGEQTGPAIRIIEVDTGATIDVPAPAASLPPVITWAPDSSGFFAIVDGAVVFVDRETGETTELAGLNALAGDVRGLVARPSPPPEPPPAGVESSILVTLSGPTGLDLVAVGFDGRVLDIDLDSRVYTTYEGLRSSGAPATVFADQRGVTVVSWDDAPGFRLDYGSTPVRTDGSAIRGPLHRGPVPGTVWRERPAAPRGSVEFELVGLTGEGLGASIEIDDADALGSDGRGGLLVAAAGGVYAATPEGSQRVSTGELIAAGPTAVIARECDEALACAVVHVDRATGARSAVAEPLASAGAIDPTVTATIGSSVSPDGEVAFGRASRSGLRWLIVDLAAGTVLDVPGPAAGASILWSADSRYAAYLSGGRLRVYDRDEIALRTVAAFGDLRAIAEVQLVDEVAGTGGAGGGAPTTAGSAASGRSAIAFGVR